MNDIKVSTQFGPGVATINHSASSYGQPVVVVDGQAYGPAEIGPVDLPPYGDEDIDLDIAEMHAALSRAGYQVNA